MKVTLSSKEANCTKYGLKFDLYGVCECDKDVAQSLLDTGVLLEVKEAKPTKASKK